MSEYQISLQLQNKTIGQDRIIFDDVAEFESTMDALNSADALSLQAFLNDNASISPFYTTQSENDLDTLEYDDESITYVLNQDQIVQIGNWVYKIDMPTEKVYAMIDAPNQDENAILNQKQAIANLVYEYSTEDEVLDLTQLGEYAEKRPCGGEQCIGGKRRLTNIVDFTYDNTNMRAKCRVAYQRAGIYKSLISKIKIYRNDRGNWQNGEHTISMNSSGQAKARCKNGFGLAGSTGVINVHKYTVRHYASTRCLASNSLNLTTNFYAAPNAVTPLGLGILTKLQLQ